MAGQMMQFLGTALTPGWRGPGGGDDQADGMILECGDGGGGGGVSLLAIIKCIYLPPTYLHFIQDIEDMCLLLMSSMSFVDLPFQEHRMTEKHHMDQNPCISSLCPK
jgi:hypothetical protein